MTDKVIENNQVTIMGEIISDFAYSHEIFGEGFYMVDVKVQRLSESFDIIPLMVSASKQLVIYCNGLRNIKGQISMRICLGGISGYARK